MSDDERRAKQAEYARTWYEKHRDEYNARRRAQRRQRWAERDAALAEAKRQLRIREAQEPMTEW